MGMFCNQCQESIHGTGCTARGVCGKDEMTAKLQDTLVYATVGLAIAAGRQAAGFLGKRVAGSANRFL